MISLDLSQVPTADLRAELKRRKPPRGNPGKLLTCPQCQHISTATQRRKPCLGCGRVWPLAER